MTNERKIILPENFDIHDTEWARHLLGTPRLTKEQELIYAQVDKTMGITSNAPPQPVLTVEKIRQAMDDLKERMKKFEAPALPRIHVSDLALVASNKPKRVHVRRWYHTKKYHLKKQEQFNKEYGFVMVPGVYYVNPQKQYEFGFWSLHHQQPYYVVHSKLYEELKKQLEERGIVNLETLVNKF